MGRELLTTRDFLGIAAETIPKGTRTIVFCTNDGLIYFKTPMFSLMASSAENVLRGDHPSLERLNNCSERGHRLNVYALQENGSFGKIIEEITGDLTNKD